MRVKRVTRRVLSRTRMTLTPDLALAYLRELSADYRAGVVLDAEGRPLAGDERLATAARAALWRDAAAGGAAGGGRAGAGAAGAAAVGSGDARAGLAVAGDAGVGVFEGAAGAGKVFAVRTRTLTIV